MLVVKAAELSPSPKVIPVFLSRLDNESPTPPNTQPSPPHTEHHWARLRCAGKLSAKVALYLLFLLYSL